MRQIMSDNKCLIKRAARYHVHIMPSWNIHTAHVERLLADHKAGELGIEDANAFLFGNYAPDIYLGFMVEDTTYRIDYCLTHNAVPHVIPVPDADRFWDECICHPVRKAATPSGTSLALGAWAHLVADRTYNARFRSFCETHDVPHGDELRRRKQADFGFFGQTLGTSRLVDVTPELLEAARAFRPYSILPEDVRRAVDVANAITREGGRRNEHHAYRLLDPAWMRDAFEACNAHLESWLLARVRLLREDAPITADAVRRETLAFDRNARSDGGAAACGCDLRPTEGA